MPITEATDTLDLLIAESQRWPLLTATEELELAKRIERGDLTARERMIVSNLRLVISIARRYQGNGLHLADLVQEGMFGLIRASEKYDWRKGFRFSTYATCWIRQSIQRGIENTSRTIRLPVHVGQRARKLARAERTLTASLGHEPTVEELAAATGFTVQEITDLRSHHHGPVSLDVLVGADGDTPLGELIAHRRPQADDELEQAQLTAALERAVSVLNPKERQVIELRYATAPGVAPHSLSAIGKVIGLSAERARQMEDRALRRLATNPELRELRAVA